MEEQDWLGLVDELVDKKFNFLMVALYGCWCVQYDGRVSEYLYMPVKGHPELVVYSLSEEVGKMHVEGKTDLKVGDKILIIPNHACSSANLTGKLIGFRGDTAERILEVDIRGNSTAKNF